MKKRITSFVMAILMLISLLPTNVFAVTVDENGASVYELGDSKWLPAGQTPADATAEGTAWSPVYGEDDNQLTKQGLCDQAEHTHNYNCADDCALAHTHADECYTTVYACGLEANDGHVHGNACYEKVCTLEETVGHVHGMTCKALTCTDTTEGHVHAETCYDMTGANVCGIEAGAGAHAHEAKCYNLEKMVCTTEIGAGAHAHTEECAPATSLTCELAEHTCVTDGCAADCAIAEHTHTAECDMETVYAKWEVTAQMMTLANEDLETAAAKGLPVHFFIAEPGQQVYPNGDYMDYKTSLWGKNNGNTGAYATADAATVLRNGDVRNANDESFVTKYVSTWGEGQTSETVKQFVASEITFGSYDPAQYEIKWVTACYRVGYYGSGTAGTRCYCRVNYPHIHIDGILTKRVQPAEIKITKEISAVQNEDVSFKFELVRMEQDSSYAPTDKVDTSFDPLDMTATIPAGQTSVQITPENRVITFGYYRLTEADHNGWRPTSVRINGNTVDVGTLYLQVATDGTLKYSTSLKGNYQEAKSIVVVNTPEALDYEYPDLTVQKVAAEDSTKVLPGAAFTLTGPNNYTANATTADNGLITFEDLKPGTYTLTETAAPSGYSASQTSYTVNVVWDKDTEKTENGQIIITKHYKVEGLTDGKFVVENEKIPGELTITKVFAGDLKDKDVTITVTGPDYENTFTLNAANNSKTLEELELGTYTITETNAEADGYILKADYQTSVELTDAVPTASVTVTNTYTMDIKTVVDTIDLTFKKVGDDGKALDGAEFRLVGTGYDKTAESKDGGVVTFEDLTVGEYTLTETKAPAGYAKDNTEYKFSVVEGIPSNPIYDETEKKFIVRIPVGIEGLNLPDNAIQNSKIYGELTVKKEFAEDSDLKDQEVVVNITYPNGSVVPVTLKSGAWSAKLTNLELGTYTVAEADAKVAGYTLTTTYSAQTVELKDAENTAEVTVTNRYEKNIGDDILVLPDLTVNKLDQDGEALEGATFQLVGVKDGAEVYNKTQTAGTALFEDLVEGDYTLTETVVPAGYKGTEPVTFSVFETGREENLVGDEFITTITYAMDGVSENTIDVINTQQTDIVHNPASFKIVKINQDGKPLDGAIFTLTAPDGTKTEKSTANGGMVEFTDLKGGDDGKAVEYTLEETAAPAGYAKTNSTWTVTVQDKNNGEVVLELNEEKNVWENIWDWVIGSTNPNNWNGTTKTLTVTNNIIKGSLTINKVFAPYTPVDVEDGVNITVTGPENYSETVKLNEENDWTVTLTDLLPGVYTITEDAESAKAHNYVWTMSVEGAEKAYADYTYTVEVPMATNEPGSAEVIITNSYTLYGSAEFMVHKTGVNGDVVLDEILAGAKFGLFNENGDEVDSQITDDRGNAFFSIMEEGTYTLKETEAPEGYLLNDTEYTVEVILDGENYDVPTYVATIEGAENGVLIVENQHITGEITITKDFEYEVAEGFEVMPEEITVTVDGEEYVLNAENEWSVTVEDLLPGEYTITEDTASAMFQGYTLGVTYNGEDTGVIEVPAQNGAVVEMAIVNTYTQEFNDDTHVPASFVVYKEDEDGNALEGAEFTLYNEEGQIFEVVTTAINEEGKAVAVFDELYGIKETKEAVTYTLKETAAPAGYTPIDTEWTVIVEEDDGEVRIEIEENADKFDKFWDWIIGEGSDVDGVLVVENEQTVLTINTDLAYTLNGVASKKLDGMEVPETEYTYTITYKVGEEEKSETVTVAEGEQEKVYGIPVGAAYTITVDTTAEYFDSTVAYETRSGVMPETGVTEADVLHTYHYFTVDVTKEVVVEKNGINVPETILNTILGNKTYAMLLSTYDVNDKMDGTEVLDVAAGETKTFETILLMGAKYDVHEGVTSEDAYVPSFEVDEENHEVTVTNTYTFVEGVDLEIDMIKTASNKKRTPLAGAKFTLKDADGDVMGYYTSAKDGTFVIDEITEPGTYTLTETKAPDGYYKLNKAVTIEIGEIYTVTTGPDEEPIIVRDLVVEDVKNGKVEDLDDGSFRIKNDEITDNSKTGDQFNTVLWVGLGATAAAALVILLILGKKRAR